MLREDLDAAIALPPRDEWRPTRADSQRRGRRLFALAAGAALLLVVVVVIAGQLASQKDQQREVPASPPPPTPASATLQLTIKSSTGAPVYGAVVNVYYDEACCHFVPRIGLDREPVWWSRTFQMSDQAGSYRIPASNGRFKLYVWVPLSVRPGDPRPNTEAYAPQWLGGSDFQTARVVEVAGKDVVIDVTLAPGHVISGRVLDRRGIWVQSAIDVYSGGGAPCCTWVDTAVGNPDGYRVAVANGTYRVKAQTASLGPLDVGPARWWRDGADFGTATDVVVQDADVTGIDVVLPIN